MKVEVRITENSNFQFVLQSDKSQKQQMVGESGSTFQIILCGDKSANQELTVNEPPAYRSTYVSGAQVDDTGHLILSFSDGSTVDSGYVRGGTGAQGPQGASLEWRGEWLSTASYSYLDCVTYGGNVYIYISSTSSVATPVTDTTRWEVMLRRGEAGTDGATFTPAVSVDGVLSWTNNGNLTNPASVNIKGPQGNGFKVLGYYSTVAMLTASVTSPAAGDAYGIGASEPYDIYIFDGVMGGWVNNGPLQGAQGGTGTTFTPHLSADGVLSWTNDGGKENPASVNIKGQAGRDGTDGTNGAPGAPGQAGTTFTPSVSTDGVLSWTNDGGKENPASVDIKGPTGEAGAGAELFYVGCGIHAEDTYDQSVTHTKTYDEILAAYKAGKACYARVKLFGAYNTNLLLLPLAEVNEAFGYVDFALTKMTQGDTSEELMIYYVHIDSDGNAEGYWGTRYTLSGSEKFLPSVTAADNGKFMCVANGAWSAVTVPDAEGGSY